MKIIEPINEMPDGTCRTIKARIFAQNSACNILDFSKDGGGIQNNRSNRV